MNNHGVFHPSIDALVAKIQDDTRDRSPTETEELRDVCRKKLRSYALEAYVKRYSTPAEQLAATERWETVNAFAHRHGRV